MLNKYFKMETDLIIYLQKLIHGLFAIFYVLSAIYTNNNLFGTNLERFIITTRYQQACQ